MQIEIIQNKIFEIRGQKVMLDFDLAVLYEVETKRLKEAVRRNMDRFPSDFMFELSNEEYFLLRTQIATLKDDEMFGRGKHSKYAPFAFTEHGVTMLASVLRSERAVQVNIAIVRAIVALRQLTSNYKEVQAKIAQLEDKYDMQFLDIYEMLQKLIGDSNKQKNWEGREPIGFKRKK